MSVLIRQSITCSKQSISCVQSRQSAFPSQYVAAWLSPLSHQPQRGFAVYAVGESWTGALGTGHLDHIIHGHHDDEEADLAEKIFDGEVSDAALGWGHTAIVTGDKRLLVTGRPHDFSALLRLKRLPSWLRDYSVRRTFQSTSGYDDAAFNPTSLVGRLVTWLIEVFQANEQDWEKAREHSMMATLQQIELPANEGASSIDCSAGFSVCISEHGVPYAFGLNGYGQCGIGATSNNVWLPERVTGLSSDFADRPRAEMEQSFPISQVALGLQHGIVMNSNGEVFAWGKGERGQLGQETLMGESVTALPIKKSLRLSMGSKPVYQALGKVIQIASGMLHSAALTENNEVVVWGKHQLPDLRPDAETPFSDARSPIVIPGLPPDKKVEQIACGSHHTSMLLEDGSVWAVGVSSDTKQPMHTPVVLIPAGVLSTPVRQFAAHMDRTTIVGSNGRQVLQVHLWQDPEFQQEAAFSPPWIDRLLDEDPNIRIREVHRSWVHSIAITD